MTEPQQRLFVALELPELARNALFEWAGPICSAAQPALRALPAESFHVTLCFLGGVAAGRVPAIERACEIVRGTGVRELGFTTARWLPRRRPRVLAVEIDDPGGRVRGLQSDLSQALQAIGALGSEGRPFLPHTTVARVRRDARVTADDLAELPPARFRPEAVVLYRSHLGAGPPRYEPLHRVALSGEIISP